MLRTGWTFSPNQAPPTFGHLPLNNKQPTIWVAWFAKWDVDLFRRVMPQRGWFDNGLGWPCFWFRTFFFIRQTTGVVVAIQQLSGSFHFGHVVVWWWDHVTVVLPAKPHDASVERVPPVRLIDVVSKRHILTTESVNGTMCTIKDEPKSNCKSFQIGLEGRLGVRAWAHSIARSWIPMSSQLIVYLLPFLSYLAGSKSISTRLSTRPTWIRWQLPL